MNRFFLLPAALLLAACSSPETEQGSSGSAGAGASSEDGGSSAVGGQGGSSAGGSSAGGSSAGGSSAGGSSAGGSAQGGSAQGGSSQGGTSAGGSTGSAGGPPGDKRVVGYFAAWSVYGRDYHVPDIPADLVTHINYAFANISDSGECVMGDPYADSDKFYDGDSWDPGAKRGSFHQLELLKAAHPSLRTLISVGGWTWSSRFSDVALTDQSRQKFVTSCVAFVKQWGFDGIDIDWEYPVAGGLDGNVHRPEDKQNYTLLLQALRDGLDAQGSADGKQYDLTIAAPAGPGTYANMELAKVGSVVSWINLMAYDFHGGWDTTTNFNAPLFASANDPSADPDVKAKFNAAAAVEGYLASGVPADKLVLGTPAYGRGYATVADKNNGLFQAFSGMPQGTWEAGMFDYHDIKANYIPKMTRYWSDEGQVPWLYSPATGVMISYDDPQSIQKKADLVNQKGLGGAMVWELSGDDDAHDILSTLHAALGQK